MMPPSLIVGLGNPGERYRMTRHNIGTLVLTELAMQMGCTMKEEKRFEALIGKVMIKDRPLFLMVPTTYMNNSGRAVQKVCSYFKIQPQETLVLVDDVEIPMGTLRLKPKGSSGGHNGLKSIQQELKTQNYMRLRLGVGRDNRKELSGYVLEKFSKNQQDQIEKMARDSIEAMMALFEQSIEAVMAKMNRKKEPSLKKEVGDINESRD